MKAWVAIGILVATLISSCNEIEKVVLLKTELESQTDSLLTIRGVLVDLPDAQTIVEYGHCWSEQHEPTINDQFTLTPNSNAKTTFDFTSEISEFKGSQAYFFRSYIKMGDGNHHYGNTIIINTGRVKGRWTQLPYENKYRVKMSYELTVGNVDVSETALFQEIALYKNDLYKLNGKIDTWLKPEGSDRYSGASTAIYASESESRIEKLQDSQWAFYAKPLSFRGYGTLNILDGNFLYYGAGLKDWGGYYAYPPYQIYFPDDYGGGFESRFFRYELQNGITQELTSFPRADCIFSTNFIIGTNIYKISGWNGFDSYSQKVWKYNTHDNTWVQLNDFPGAGRMHAVSFVLKGRAYIGLGYTAVDIIKGADDETFIYPTTPVDDFWEYDPVDDRWTQLSDFPGGARAAAFSFGIQDFGYVGTGMVSFTKKYLKDFWRFDPIDKTWARLDDFPGSPRFGASACANGQKAIVGLGWQISEDSPAEIAAFGDPYQHGFDLVPNIYFPELDADLWEFDPSRN